MKILWANPNFLHPTTKGGQIRTLEMLRCLHREHEIHYVALIDPKHPEGPARAGEYCTRAYPIEHHPPVRGSVSFALQAVGALLDPLPLAISRWRSTAMRRQIETLLAQERFDSVVCDFLAPAPNFPSLAGCVLFQHNVETVIWRRHAETATSAIHRIYMELQAKRMESYEARCCRESQHVIAVSETDAERMRDWFGLPTVAWVPTGVDLETFAPPEGRVPDPDCQSDLVFTGSMDWSPNIEGMLWFAAEVLPLIRAERPSVSVAIVGRDPAPALRNLATSDARIRVTGTVPNIRPWLWDSAVSIVPLRVGGGTRLKIFEAVAAGVPVVSTTVGAEGLPLTHPTQIRLADSPAAFAAECLALLASRELRRTIANDALIYVAERYSWAKVTAQFADILARFPYPRS
jgi:glycosyltransferase involved in cell wall biosynthesis